MTLHEIEQTLHTLQTRHDGLDEDMLVTLLRGGGWEEKNIQDAIFLFRSGSGRVGARPAAGSAAKEAGTPDSLPAVQSEPVFMPQADEKHLLLGHNETPSFFQQEILKAQTEPQSLVQPATQPAISKREDFPHNLPLRPFETSEHIWPFSRYRDVFYGDAEPKMDIKKEKETETPAAADVSKEEAKIEPSISAAPAEANIEKKDVIKEERPQAISLAILPEKEIIPVPLTKGDEKLVVLASVMLVAVLLLLGYMYSNGRL